MFKRNVHPDAEVDAVDEPSHQSAVDCFTESISSIVGLKKKNKQSKMSMIRDSHVSLHAKSKPTSPW